MASNGKRNWTEEMTANYHGQSHKFLQCRWLYDHTLIQYMGDVEGKSVLDVGCGDGRFCRFIKSKGATGRVVGVDLSPLMISFAKEDDEKATVHCEYQVGDARQLEKIFEFDFVTITNVLHYVETTAEMTDMCRSFYRNLKPGGIFYGILLSFSGDINELYDRGSSLLKYGYLSISLLPKDGESTPVKIVLGNSDVDQPPILMTAHMFKPEEYENAFLTAGFQSVEHRPVLVDKHLNHEYPEDFWDLFLENPIHFCYIARK